MKEAVMEKKEEIDFERPNINQSNDMKFEFICISRCRTSMTLSKLLLDDICIYANECSVCSTCY